MTTIRGVNTPRRVPPIRGVGSRGRPDLFNTPSVPRGGRPIPLPSPGFGGGLPPGTIVERDPRRPIPLPNPGFDPGIGAGSGVIREPAPGYPPPRWGAPDVIDRPFPGFPGGGPRRPPGGDVFLPPPGYSAPYTPIGGGLIPLPGIDYGPYQPPEQPGPPREYYPAPGYGGAEGADLDALTRLLSMYGGGGRRQAPWSPRIDRGPAPFFPGY